jgi:Rod binding domain-containing protein
MQIGSTTTPLGAGLTNPAAARTGLARDQADFARILSMADPGRGGATTEAALDERARDAAEQLVAVVLVEPILKQLRESSQASPPFAPTDGEKQFRSMLDAKLAHEITGAARFPLVERLARDLRSHLRTDA